MDARAHPASGSGLTVAHAEHVVEAPAETLHEGTVPCKLLHSPYWKRLDDATQALQLSPGLRMLGVGCGAGAVKTSGSKGFHRGSSPTREPGASRAGPLISLSGVAAGAESLGYP
jgi:hypothetical protein